MTSYQTCHRHLGGLEHETETAHILLQRHGAPKPDTVKELRQETDMPMSECAQMLRCMWRDMEFDRLKAENAKLWNEVKVLEDKIRELTFYEDMGR